MRRRLVASLAAVFALAWSAPVAAQTDWPLDSFNAHRLYVAPGPGNFVLVESNQTGPDLLPTFGATLSYANRPYVADDLDCWTTTLDPGPECAIPQNQETDLLDELMVLQLYGAITLIERVQIGLNLPIVLYGDGDGYEYVLGASPRTAGFAGAFGGLADPRISAKVRILDPDHQGNGVTLGASAWVNLPLGYYIADGRFIGDRSPNVGAHMIGGFRFDGFRLALNLGFAFREEAQNIRSVVGFEAIWGLAAGYRFAEWIGAQVELTGATSFGARFDSEAPTEIRGAFDFYLGDFTFQVGGGAGLVYGVGVPVGHGFLGFSYAPTPPSDTDGDGLNDDDDGCPGDAEDMDGFEDEDGCPELDNDGDEIPDGADPCPEEAEDIDEYEDEDGCPEEDNDSDGIRDGYDSCPNTPEDMDGDRDTDGCPDADTDGDGIEDSADQCPNDAEDFDGLLDEDGCPEEDADEDTIPDETDECPEEAEDMDGYRDRDGCPDDRASRQRRQRGRE